MHDNGDLRRVLRQDQQKPPSESSTRSGSLQRFARRFNANRDSTRTFDAGSVSSSPSLDDQTDSERVGSCLEENSTRDVTRIRVKESKCRPPKAQRRLPFGMLLKRTMSLQGLPEETAYCTTTSIPREREGVRSRRRSLDMSFKDRSRPTTLEGTPSLAHRIFRRRSMNSNRDNSITRGSVDSSDEDCSSDGMQSSTSSKHDKARKGNNPARTKTRRRITRDPTFENSFRIGRNTRHPDLCCDTSSTSSNSSAIRGRGRRRSSANGKKGLRSSGKAKVVFDMSQNSFVSCNHVLDQESCDSLWWTKQDFIMRKMDDRLVAAEDKTIAKYLKASLALHMHEEMESLVDGDCHFLKATKENNKNVIVMDTTKESNDDDDDHDLRNETVRDLIIMVTKGVLDGNRGIEAWTSKCGRERRDRVRNVVKSTITFSKIFGNDAVRLQKYYHQLTAHSRAIARRWGEADSLAAKQDVLRFEI